jgi:hypothetical protein
MPAPPLPALDAVEAVGIRDAGSTRRVGGRGVPAAPVITLTLPGVLREAFNWMVGTACRSHESAHNPSTTATVSVASAPGAPLNHRLPLVLRPWRGSLRTFLQPEGGFRVREGEVAAEALRSMAPRLGRGRPDWSRPAKRHHRRGPHWG